MSAVLSLPVHALPRALDPDALQLITEKVRRASSVAVLAHAALDDGPAADAISVADDLLAEALSMLEDIAPPPAAVVPLPAARARSAR